MTATTTLHKPPVALVVLRHPETGDRIVDIAMLIDTGADATLLHGAVVSRLGVASTGERYQLIAFDGTVSESAAVRVDLLFLNRRFRGRYLLVDAEVGVIGRDILNHLRIVLDGPNRLWEEQPPLAGGG